MIKRHRIGSYKGKDLMSDLISENYQILHALNRFGIPLGVGNNTIEEVCYKNSVDTTTFLAIINLLTIKEKEQVKSDLDKISAPSLLGYLRNSHTYYLEYRLPQIRCKLVDAIGSTEAVSIAILDYFDQYVSEVKKHMNYEEEVVFPYVEAILEKRDFSNYTIGEFSDHHDHIEDKLSELKSILIKYCPVQTSYELSSALVDIFTCEEQLSLHNNIEDYILIPLIENFERKIL